MNLGNKYKEALRLKYEAQIAEAEATLDLYFTNLTAIGEHSNLLDEHDKWVTILADAKGKLETLNGIEINDQVEKLFKG